MNQVIHRYAYAPVILIIFFIGLNVFMYISDSEEIHVPLEEGMIFRFKGKYHTLGNQKTITMDAPEHQLIVDRVFEKDGETFYHLSFQVMEQNLHSFILCQDDQGLSVVNGKNKTLVIPRDIKRGQKWKFEIGSSIVNAKAGKREVLHTGEEALWGREIAFQSNERTRVRLLLNNEKGFVGIHYSYIRDGSARNEADLYLTHIDSAKNKK